MNYATLSMREWTEQNKPENRAHFENDYKSFLGAEARRIMAHEVFDTHGNFIMRGFDPYRTADGTPQQTLRDFLFDSDGAVHDTIAAVLHSMLCTDALNWSCDAVKLHYAEMHGSVTSNSYPATYMWK